MTLAELWAMLTGFSGAGRGFHEVRYETADARFISTTSCDYFVSVLGESALERRFVSVCPRIDRTPHFAVEANVLWARVQGNDQARALLNLEPHPTVVLRDGPTTRRTALWALNKPLKPDWAEKAVLRLQHRVGGAQKAVADPTWVFEPPCSWVGVESYDPDALYTARQVVGALSDPPKQWDGWKREAA
jgi:hypothetical protein